MRFLYGGLIKVKKEMARRYYAYLLRKCAETGQAKGLDKRLVGRLRNMIAFLDAADSLKELKIPPNFGSHIVSGDRAGQAAMTVTKNWRLTFRLNNAGQIIDLDLEDYH